MPSTSSNAGSPTSIAAGWKIRSRQLSQSSPLHAPPLADANTTSSAPARGHRSRQAGTSLASGPSSRVWRSTTVPDFVAR